MRGGRPMREEDLRDEQVYQLARADEWLWTRASAMGVSRRRLLQMLAAGAAAAGAGQVLRGRRAGAAPAGDLLVKPTPPEFFIDFGGNKEMRWEGMYPPGYVVPNELF